MPTVSKFPQPGYKNPYPRAIGSTSGSGGLAAGASKYIPNNGFNKSPYQPGFQSYGTALGTIASVPADLGVLVLSDMLGNTYNFQFVRAGSSLTPGDIEVAVPAGGGTTAQSNTALVAAINAANCNMKAVATGSTTFTITQSIAGPSATNNYSIAGIAGTSITFAPSNSFGIPAVATQPTPALRGWLPGYQIENGGSI